VQLLSFFHRDTEVCVVVFAACIWRVHQAGHANPAAHPGSIGALAQLGEAWLPNVDLYDTTTPVAKVDKHKLAATASCVAVFYVCNLPNQFHAITNMAGSKCKVESIDNRERARVQLPAHG
jgi:hypothetical protein